jgi:hypothetical protein
VAKLNKKDVEYQLRIDYSGNTPPKIVKLTNREIAIRYGYQVNPKDVIKSIQKVEPAELKHKKWGSIMTGGGVHLFSYDLVEGKVNEAKFTKVHAAKAMKLVKGTSVDKIIPKGDILYVNYTAYKDRAKIAQALGKLYKYDNDGRSTNAPRGIIGLGGANWMSFINEYGAMNKMSDYEEKEQPVKEGTPFPVKEPNEFVYMDFKKWVKRNERHIRDDLKNYTDTKIFKRMEYWWSKWDKQANKGAFSNIRGNEFGRKLILMLRNDKLLFKSTGNKISNLKN